MISRPTNPIRLNASIFAAILGIQSIWLLGAQLTRAKLPFFLTNGAEVETTSAQADAAKTAAWFGWPRGDLWVDYAMTVDAPIIGNIDRGMGSNLRPANGELRLVTERAARLAPYDSRAWLMLAATNAQPGQQADKALAQIKMSYYTAPNDIRLMPFRIQIATRSSAIADDELQSLLENDLRTIVRSHPELKQSIALAYRGASPAGRHFLETKLADLDAGFLAQLQGAKP